MVISSSPIEYLRIVCDDGLIGANVGFDSIIDHLVKKHSGSLRVLDFRSAYIGVDAVRALFTRCLQLEAFHISAGKNALVGRRLRLVSELRAEMYAVLIGYLP